MTVAELLNLPTAELAKLSDKELEELLGPLVPEARRPDKEALVLTEAKRLGNQAAMILAQLKKKS